MRVQNLHRLLLSIPFLGMALAANAQCTISGIQNITVSNSPGLCAAPVNFSLSAGNCTITSAPASGSMFQVGTTTVNVTATSSTGATTTASFTVTVNDTEAPKITNVSASPNTLWPPNHKMRDVAVNYSTSDNCGGPVTCGLSVTSNEPVNGIGDGNTAPDWIVIDAHKVQLRAERAGPLSGRVYTITIGCRDVAGNNSTATTTVTVPHDQGNKKGANLKVNVGPNPSNSNFSFNVDSEDLITPLQISITDLQGRVFEVKNAKSRQSVNMGTSLKAGTYIVKVTQGDSQTETQIIKQ